MKLSILSFLIILVSVHFAQSFGQKINGFKILKIEKGSLFEQLGLREGDVIERVNNKKMKSTSDGMELYNALKTEKNIDLDIERNGQKETIHYSIK